MSEESFLYSDEAMTVLAARYQTANAYADTNGLALGNYSSSVISTYNAAGTLLKTAETVNTFDDQNRGFIASSVTTTRDENGNALTQEEKINHTYNKEGFALTATLNSYTYSDGKVLTQSIEQACTRFDRQGRVMLESDIYKSRTGAVKKETTTTRYYYSGGQTDIITNKLGDGRQWGREEIRYLAFNSAGKPLVSVTTTYKPDSMGGGIADEKTVSSTYDIFGNATTQDVLIRGMENGVMVNQLRLERTSEYNQFGWVSFNKTITSLYDSTAGQFVVISRSDTSNSSFNNFGNALSQEVISYIWENGGWKEEFTTQNASEYDAQTSALLNTTSTRFSPDGSPLRKTVTTNNAFNDYDNATDQTITTTYDAATGLWQCRRLSSATIRNALGWELSYNETVTNAFSPDLNTTKTYTASEEDFDFYGRVYKFTETTTSASASIRQS